MFHPSSRIRYAEQNPDAAETVVMGARKILRTIREWKQDADKREKHEIDRLTTHETPLAKKEVSGGTEKETVSSGVWSWDGILRGNWGEGSVIHVKSLPQSRIVSASFKRSRLTRQDDKDVEPEAVQNEVRRFGGFPVGETTQFRTWRRRRMI
ncbi:hypothetical protein EV421DRAFT_1816528 [Armillaria borealis]|uniref:Uncharacterized protein n=1 Tax=Armillaria borealis TaxID=47425 RepID=A0AA39JCL0_9AGAR|nr:hypothetical protein EV421DRAFT_1816528 [Armillaria borealis]